MFALYFHFFGPSARTTDGRSAAAQYSISLRRFPRINVLGACSGTWMHELVLPDRSFSCIAIDHFVICVTRAGAPTTYLLASMWTESSRRGAVTILRR